MPITEQTYAVLFEGKPVRAALQDLMAREQVEEISGPLADVSRRFADLARAQKRD